MKTMMKKPAVKKPAMKKFAAGGAVAKKKPVKKYAMGGMTPEFVPNAPQASPYMPGGVAAKMQQQMNAPSPAPAAGLQKAFINQQQQAELAKGTQQAAAQMPAAGGTVQMQSMQERMRQDAADQEVQRRSALGKNTQRAVYAAEKAMQRPGQAVRDYEKQQYESLGPETNTMAGRMKLQADMMADKKFQTIRNKARKTAQAQNANIQIAQQRDAAAAEKKKINDFIMSQRKQRPVATTSPSSGGENLMGGFAKGGAVKKKAVAAKGKKK